MIYRSTAEALQEVNHQSTSLDNLSVQVHSTVYPRQAVQSKLNFSAGSLTIRLGLILHT